MQWKLIIAWILFVIGILLQLISDIVDIWIIGVIGGILWPVGMVMGVNASIVLNQKSKAMIHREKTNYLKHESERIASAIPGYKASIWKAL